MLHLLLCVHPQPSPVGPGAYDRGARRRIDDSGDRSDPEEVLGSALFVATTGIVTDEVLAVYTLGAAIAAPQNANSFETASSTIEAVTPTLVGDRPVTPW